MTLEGLPFKVGFQGVLKEGRGRGGLKGGLKERRERREGEHEGEALKGHPSRLRKGDH